MIPIELPGWVQPAFYVFLLLMAVEIGVLVWSTIKRRSQQQILEEILGKLRMLMLQKRIDEEEMQQSWYPDEEDRYYTDHYPIPEEETNAGSHSLRKT